MKYEIFIWMGKLVRYCKTYYKFLDLFISIIYQIKAILAAQYLQFIVFLKTFTYFFYLTHFTPLPHFYSLWKRQKTFGFLTFSGAIEMWHWTKKGLIFKSTKSQLLEPRRAIVTIPLNTDLTWVQTDNVDLNFQGALRLKPFANRFQGMPFESFKVSVAKMHKLRVWIETDVSIEKTSKSCFSL